MADEPKNLRPDETFEPYEEYSRIPLPVLWIAIALAIWGVFMLYDTGQDVVTAQDERVEEHVAATDPPLGEGETLFLANCSTCHQTDGLGLHGAVPPLAGSEVVAGGPEVVSRILLRGIDGPITVAGESFNGHMPSFASALSNDEIAQIATYVGTSFGGSATRLNEKDVAAVRLDVGDALSFRGGQEIAMLVPGLPLQPAVPTSPAPDAPEAATLGLVFQGRGSVWACASCHGDLGQGNENTPRLAGLPAVYVAEQLAAFRDGSRSNESMRLVAQGLDEAERLALGRYFAGLRVPSTARPTLSADLARGEELALRGDWSLGVPACFTCHGSSGFGVAPNFPTLAAQHAPYTASQLAAWAGGHRTNSPLGLMQRIAEALSTADRRAVADYLASLPPVPAGEMALNREVPDAQ
ncbi:c-type cytochrome [Cereibacter sphaeroides]|uniref:c-type cytochrome n=1 Tax=Cereibacter sphaeroides TaxID=1063 RepID=UPI00313CD721